MSRGRHHACLLACALVAATAPAISAARADEPSTPAAVAKSVAPAPQPRRHALYLELLGKGGLWGVGYDYTLTPRFALGGTASYYVLDGEHVVSLSPYAALYPLANRRHRWFVHAGPQVVHLERPSPVPEWPGTRSTGVGAEVSTGYELRTRVLVRAFAMGTVGKNGFAPWIGGSVGFTL